MNKTQIEWVKNPDGSQGFTWNPISGCLNGCDYCYARKLANGRLKSRYLVGGELAPLSQDGLYSVSAKDLRLEAVHNPFYPRLWSSKIDCYSLTNSWRCPKGIFVCDMSDLFGIGIPEEWTKRVLDKISSGENKLHRFYILTKQPQNLVKFSPFPDNAWVGVSATDRDKYIAACMHLGRIEAKVKYLSLEPLLNWVHVREVHPAKYLQENGIGWVIIGAQTKPTVMPNIEWVQEIVEGCDKSNIPVFLKDNLMPLLGLIGNCKTEFTAIQENSPDSHNIVLRQEFPRSTH